MDAAQLELDSMWRDVEENGKTRRKIAVLWCPQVDLGEFIHGFYHGLTAAEEETPMGDTTHGRIPDSWSRGFAAGYVVYPLELESVETRYPELSYNKVVRKLREKYPDEFPLPPEGQLDEKIW